MVTGVVSSMAYDAKARRDEPSNTGMSVVAGKQAGVFKVIYKGNKPGKVKLSIVDASGSLVHSESFKDTDGFIRPYNFNDLAEGEYSIIVADENGKLKETVMYSKGATLKMKATVVQLADVKNKYLVLVPKSVERLTVKIFDENGNILHTDAIVANGEVARKYDLSNVNSSNFTFEISDKQGLINTVTK